MQQQAGPSNKGKRTGALLLPAKHAVPRHLDSKVEDPHEQEVVGSAASTHEEHQRVSHKKDGDGTEQEHADHHESPHLEQHKRVMEERHEELERGEACMACGCQWSRDHHKEKHQHEEEVLHGRTRHSARLRLGHTRHRHQKSREPPGPHAQRLETKWLSESKSC